MAQQNLPADIPRPPTDFDVLLIGAGNSGEAAALRCQALGYGDGVWFNAVGLNNDRLAPRPLLVRRPDGASMPLELTERLVLDGESPRDQLADYPLLERRYQRLLRGTVWQTIASHTANVLRQLAKTDAEDLAAMVRTMARQAADQALALLGIAELIELDAGAAAAPDSDPLVPIGQTLLQRAQRPAWQLTRGARPRTETLQITEDGTPLFSLEGLQSAASGGDAWRMGFIEVQLAVAREDLALWREADDMFKATLRQRNLYVVDDLAIAWEAAQDAQSLAAPDQIMHNGQYDQLGGDLDY